MTPLPAIRSAMPLPARSRRSSGVSPALARSAACRLIVTIGILRRNYQDGDASRGRYERSWNTSCVGGSLRDVARMPSSENHPQRTCHSLLRPGSPQSCDAVLQEEEREVQLEDLRIFVEVADAGGISSAALRLGISKSMVSRRITQLEAELGAQLLARTTRGIALTEAGATFREYAAKISAELDVARETMLPAGELRGRMRVAAPLSFGPTHFAPVLSQMARRHPQLHISSSYTDRFVDLVGEGFDCAIRVGYLPDSSLVARRVGPISGKLVAVLPTSRLTARP